MTHAGVPAHRHGTRPQQLLPLPCRKVDGGNLTLAIDTEMHGPSAWVGLGLSEAGSMTGGCGGRRSRMLSTFNAHNRVCRVAGNAQRLAWSVPAGTPVQVSINLQLLPANGPRQRVDRHLAELLRCLRFQSQHRV